MKTIDLQQALIRQIAEIDDRSLLMELQSVIDSQDDSGVIYVSKDELKEIVKSKSDIEQGKEIENRILEKEVMQWLKLR